jgi:hypothetical protein
MYLFEKYLSKEISERDFIIMKHNAFYPAKQMEKQQIIDACESTSNTDFWVKYESFEQYYNETFKNK